MTDRTSPGGVTDLVVATDALGLAELLDPATEPNSDNKALWRSFDKLAAFPADVEEKSETAVVVETGVAGAETGCWFCDWYIAVLLPPCWPDEEGADMFMPRKSESMVCGGDEVIRSP